MAVQSAPYLCGGTRVGGGYLVYPNPLACAGSVHSCWSGNRSILVHSLHCIVVSPRKRHPLAQISRSRKAASLGPGWNTLVRICLLGPIRCLLFGRLASVLPIKSLALSLLAHGLHVRPLMTPNNRHAANPQLQLGRTRLRPNHSLNRTHCGVRLKARHFILGF